MAAPLPCLITARLVVRPPQLDDVDEYFDYHRRNMDFHAPWSPLPPKGVLTRQHWEDRVRRVGPDFEADSRILFCLFENPEATRVVGHAQLSAILRGPAQFCFLGYALCESAQGKGYMEEALRAVLHYAFTELRLHRVMANYMPHNRRSGALLRRLGFVVEGYARDYLMIAGRWEDHVLTALAAPGEN